MRWFTRLFRRPPPVELPAPVPEAGAPDWARELQEAVQKAARSQARTAARVESLEAKLEGGLAELRGAVGSAAAAAPAEPPRLDLVLDALDILDQARRVFLAQGQGPAERGLAGVSERLERFLAANGITRLAKAEGPLDGRVFRVVGTVDRPDLPAGTPAEVVRAAVLSGDRVLREGEVLVNRSSQP